MKNFISPISVRTNSISDEKICIGLFVSSERGIHFSYSHNKLKILKKMLSSDIVFSLEELFKGIDKEIKSNSCDEKKFSAEYFTYLNKSNNGLIEFALPKSVSKAISNDEYSSLFKLYVGERIEITPSTPFTDNKIEFKNKINKFLSRETFVNKADIHLPITNNMVSSMYRPFTVDFISCNGSFLAGHSVDFNSTIDTIEKKINEFRILAEGLKIIAAKKNLENEGDYIVYYNEPEGNSQKRLFDAAINDSSKPFKMKEIDAIAEAEKKLQSSEYKKFTEVIGIDS